MTENLTRYLAMLGLQPGASKDEINTVYYALIEKFPSNPTEEQEEEMQQLKHAWSILQRNYRPAARKVTVVQSLRTLVPALGLALVVLAVVLVAINYQNIRLAIVEYQPGDTLRWADKSEPYGKVVSFDPEHRFHVGEPSPAYEIRLAGEEKTIWLSERIVIKAMVPMDANELQAAGVGGN